MDVPPRPLTRNCTHMYTAQTVTNLKLDFDEWDFNSTKPQAGRYKQVRRIAHYATLPVPRARLAPAPTQHRTPHAPATEGEHHARRRTHRVASPCLPATLCAAHACGALPERKFRFACVLPC